MALWLSEKSVIGPSGGSPNLVRSERSQISSEVAALATMYSASMLDLVTVHCFRELQTMGILPSKKTCPEMDLRSSGSLPQSASQYASVSAEFDGLLVVKLKPSVQVPLRYRRTRLAAVRCSGPGLLAYWLSCCTA